MSKRSSLAKLSAIVCASLSSTLLFFTPARALADPPVVTIMPLGDSITVGSGGSANLGGYRGTLHTLLTNAGYTPDFIGTQTNNSSSITDQNHQGQGGWRIDQIDSNIEAWFNSVADPDVILLHIGTNDFGQNINISTAADRLNALILKMATLRPNSQIIVTNLMERGEPQNTNIVNLFNPQVPGIVAAHAGAGRKVTFLDMRAAVPLSDMPDNLHPNDAGYVKMANAWLPAIQAVVPPEGVAFAPYVQFLRSPQSRDSVTIRYSKELADNAADLANYSISDLTINSASLSANKREVILNTSPQTIGTTYTVTINNIVDRQAVPMVLPPNTTATFTPPLPRGYAANAPESAGYTLVQSIDLPQQAAYGSLAPAYSVDNRALIAGYDRVAYYLELEKSDGTFSYAWVSMNAFTNDIYKLGLPTLASGAIFEQGVTNINVVSNVPGVLQGNGMAGNLEFWPTNYTEGANSSIGGSTTLFDFDDTRGTTGNFGCMQVHNTTDKKTIFAINDWGGASTSPPTLEIGIGNQPTGNPDWTHSESGSLYTSRRLYVLVRASMDSVAPTILTATASNGRARVYVDFSEPLLPQTVVNASFALSHGVTVLATELSSNGRRVVLTTTPMPEGQTLTLTVNGIRDSSPSANLIEVNTTVSVALPVVPAEVTSRVGAVANGYQLVYSIDLPQVGNLNALGSRAYSWDDSAATQPISRVAYFLETQKPGAAAQYVWVSMKALTGDRKKIGVPTTASGAVFQSLVEDMQVLSNVAEITTGSGIATGNIEFWPTDYSVANGISIPGADVAKYDFGDTRSASGGFGSMQIHNHGASQTIFAINHWGADGSTLDIGIGNQTTTGSGVDWTNAANAGTYYKRRLHVLALPAVTPTLPTEVAANVPEAQGYYLVHSLNIPIEGNLTAPAYSVNNSSQIGSFSRVAYYMQLQTGTSTPEWVWTSMDAFTTDPTRIGVPTTSSGAIHQRIVNNMNVASNKLGIVTGTGITTGNIEFWPTAYSAPNAIGIPNSTSTTVYDFADTRTTTGNHGSMQIHNHGASQTLFAISNWGNPTSNSNRFGLGIGNSPVPANLDWTFAANSHTYSSRILHVLVMPGDADITGPVVTHATGASSLDQVSITFNEPVAEAEVVPASFNIAGLTVTEARLLPGQREVVLKTSAQTPGTAYTIAISQLKDISFRANPLAVGTTVGFTSFAMPALISSIPQAAGYELVYQVAIPAARPGWNANPVPYSVDEPKFRNMQFDRVAYVLELDNNWIFTSFDRHTSTLNKVGMPTLNVSSTPFQMNVSNLTVATNVATGITTGDFATGGNIEFWGGNYNQANTLNVPNASATTYDWGDRMDSGGYGSLQVHNHGQSQVLLAYNNWGNTATSSGDIGIGTQATGHPDWTTIANTGTFTKRNLYVLVRPGAAPIGDAPVIMASPASRTVNPGTSTTFAVTLRSTAGVTYQWRKNLTPILNATLPWLELTNIAATQAGDYDVVVTGENFVSATSATATLTVTNSAPTFGGYQFSTPMNTAAIIPAADILDNATDADGDVLIVSSAGPVSTQGGSAALASGNVTYVPANGHVGADSFITVIQDGRGGSVNGTVNVTVIGTTLPSDNGATIGRRADGKIDLAFKGTPGAQYLIRRSLTLAPGSWSTVATVTAGDDGVVPFVDPTPPDGRAFYRIETPPAM